MKTFMTLGCSWTFGVGANYCPTMSYNDYIGTAWDPSAEEKSFRTLLSKEYNFKNISYAEGGCSNARSFRLLSEKFIHKSLDHAWIKLYQNVKGDSWPTCRTFNDYENLSEDIKQELIEVYNLEKPIMVPNIVLFCITSVARNEVWDTNNKEFVNFKYDISKHKFSKFFLKNIFDYEIEIKNLSTQMVLWNKFFKDNNIKNLWVDTFNIHDYSIEVDNLIRPDDLLTSMLHSTGIKVSNSNEYHYSSWSMDSERIRTLKEHGLVNPYSFHPTAKGHKIIADFLSPYIGKLL